jgi:SAM-dependent methyltransferase
LNSPSAHEDSFLQVIEGSIYDWPRYYDFIYGSDWKAETRFLNDCLRLYARKPNRPWRLFEPACGTGRLLFRLAAEGHAVSGIDMNPHAVEYCNRRLGRAGYPRSAITGDMCDFALAQPCDAAFNTINSFRHLESDALAEKHLRCMATVIRPGGFYALGFHLTPTEGEPEEEEYWSHRRGHLQINAGMWLLNRDLSRRLERYALEFDVYTPTRQFRIRDAFNFRTYTASQFKRLLRRIPAFEIAAVYDFAYDVEKPIDVNRETQDAVFILKRVKGQAAGQAGSLRAARPPSG